MKYIREVKPTHAFRNDAYDPQILYDGESCVIIGSHVPAGKAPPPHHYHPASDQLYYIVEGEMEVQLGNETFHAGPDTLVYIPAGTPHHNWNAGASREFHFEVLAPRPFLQGPIAVPTDSTDASGKPYCVRAVAKDAFAAGPAVRDILTRELGSLNMSLQLARVEPGQGESKTHIHEFDQFYYVLSGGMSVQAGLRRFSAGPNSLVVLPAGVPHRQWNEGATTERHLILLVPEPAAVETFETAVELRAI